MEVILSKISSNYGAVGMIAVLAIIGLIAVTRMLIKEKDKELTDKNDIEQNIVISLKALNDTMHAILINIERPIKYEDREK